MSTPTAHLVEGKWELETGLWVGTVRVPHDRVATAARLYDVASDIHVRNVAAMSVHTHAWTLAGYERFECLVLLAREVQS